MTTRPTNPHPFGELLNQYRQRKPGLSQRHLAELAGYDQAILVRMAQGKKDLTGPSGRERIVRLIETLADQGVLSALDEANSLLAAASLPPLFDGQPDEARLLTRLSRVSSGHRVRRTNLPAPLSGFIGRAQEIADVRALLSQTRLLTLTGAGGSGKTRLAQRIAADVLLNYADGVWYAELAALTDATLIAETAGRIFGLASPNHTAFDGLADFLRERHALLVLDNCEQVIEGAASFVAQLLGECARLTIVTTSREALNVEGELIWRVPPMQLDEAARLFVERARLARPHQTFNAGDATVAHICQRLDGMPLAIELAAARLSALSLSDIASRLEDRFALLTEGRRGALPRHQTLQALIDWSHDLLSEPEKIVFRRLGVFVGGWTIGSAEHVVAEHVVAYDAIAMPEVLPVLTQLIHKSLVVVHEVGGETRYSYLETLRQFALERLADHGELETMRHRHALAFEAIAWGSEQTMQSPQQYVWFHKLDRDFPNLRQAVAWCFDSDGREALGCSIISGLYQFLIVAMSYLPESQRWAQLALSRMPRDLPPRARGYLHLLPGWVDAVSVPRMIAAMRQALACFEEAGDQAQTAFVKANLGRLILKSQPHTDEGQHLLDDALAMVTGARGEWMYPNVVAQHAHAAAEREDFVAAERLYREVTECARRLNNLDGITVLEHFLATTLMQLLRFDEALPHLEASYMAAQQINDSLYQMITQSHTALATCNGGDLPRAVALAEAALTQAREQLPAVHCKLGMGVLARILNDAGEPARAKALIDDMINVLRQMAGQTRGWYGAAFDVGACIASTTGDAIKAARLFGVADEEYGLVHLAAVMNEAVELDAFNGRRARYYDHGNAPYIAKARAALGDAAYEAAYAEGRAMTLEQAIDFALTSPSP